jgi:hypothetical protein
MFKRRFSIRKQWKVFYLSSYETMAIEVLEEIKWPNVQNVEPLFRHLRRHGKWLGVQTSQARGCS